jgi:hypothetical protein
MTARSSFRAGFLAVLLAWPVCVSPAFSYGVTVEPGGRVALGSGTLTLNCGDLVVSGGLSGGNGAIQLARQVDIAGGDLSLDGGFISLSGDWLNSGTFSPGTGSVNIVDGCGTTTSAMAGNSTFYRFSATTFNGRLLEVEAGSTQVFNRALILEGSASNPLVIRSSRAGTAANFDLPQGGTQRISHVDVSDNNARPGQTLAPGPPESFASVDSGGNANWFISRIAGAVSIDTLPVPALAVLTLLLMLVAARRSNHVPDKTSFP